MPPNPQSPRRRARTNDDLTLWRRVIHDVAPLRPREAHGRPEPAPAGGRPALQSGPPPKPAPAPSRAARSEPPLDSLGGIDRANAERLKRGQTDIEARLDLHGLTQSQAHEALAGFVANSQAAGRRCVLVITGRGRLGTGILRSAVPRWLAEPRLRRHLLGIAPAQPRHGGAGALYLLLRRNREG